MDDTLTSDPRYPALRVCLQHGGLYDPEPDPLTGYQQRCHDGTDQPRWGGFDYNEWIRLCDACLVVTIRSGSKFSGFFCSACREAVEYSGFGIPVGRHTLVNDLVFAGGPDHAVYVALDWIGAGIRRLRTWKAERARLVVPAGEDVPLVSFLEAVPWTSEAAAEELVAWWGGGE